MNDKKMTSATITVLGLLLIGIVMVLLAANAAHKAKSSEVAKVISVEEYELPEVNSSEGDIFAEENANKRPTPIPLDGDPLLGY